LTLSTFLLAYAALGCAVALMALARLMRDAPSIDHIKQEACRSGLPLWAASLLAAGVLVFVLVEYAALWPIRWHEALR
jgi:hypothetical protein